MKQSTTQLEQIRSHLNNYGVITSWGAIKEYGITRLSHYIYVLRKEGLKINTIPTHAVNRYGKPVTFATYSLNK